MEIIAYSWLLAIIGIVDWWSGGDRTFMGRRLYLRRTPFWVTLRWCGLLLFTGGVILFEKFNIPTASYCAFAGSIFLIFGAAKTKARHKKSREDKTLNFQ